MLRVPGKSLDRESDVDETWDGMFSYLRSYESECGLPASFLTSVLGFYLRLQWCELKDVFQPSLHLRVAREENLATEIKQKLSVTTLGKHPNKADS